MAATTFVAIIHVKKKDYITEWEKVRFETCVSYWNRKLLSQQLVKESIEKELKLLGVYELCIKKCVPLHR